VNGGPEPVWLNADPTRLEQVLANLLSNAIKFSPRGERVTVRLSRQGPGLRVGVEDRGPGVPEAFRARIFQKFAQADGSDARRRTGTTFWFDLPEWPPEAK